MSQLLDQQSPQIDVSRMSGFQRRALVPDKQYKDRLPIIAITNDRGLAMAVACAIPAPLRRINGTVLTLPPTPKKTPGWPLVWLYHIY